MIKDEKLDVRVKPERRVNVGAARLTSTLFRR